MNDTLYIICMGLVIIVPMLLSIVGLLLFIKFLNYMGKTPPKGKSLINEDYDLLDAPIVSVSDKIKVTDKVVKSIDTSDTRGVTKSLGKFSALKTFGKVATMLCIFIIVPAVAFKFKNIDERTIMLMVIVCVLPLSILSSMNSSRLSETFEDTVFYPFLARKLPNALVSNNVKVDTRALHANGVIESGISAKVSKYFCIEDSEEFFEFFNLISSSRTPGGHPMTSVHFKGQVIHFKMKSSLNATVRVITTSSGIDGLRKWIPQLTHETKVKSKYEAFNKLYRLYAANEEEGLLITNSNVISLLDKLRKKHEDYCIFIKEDDVYILLNSNKLYFDANGSFSKSDLEKGKYTEICYNDIIEVLELGKEITTIITSNIYT